MNAKPDKNSIAILAALANGIIPANDVDNGAGAVNAGERLAEKLHSGPFAAIYQKGLETAGNIAREKFGCNVTQLQPQEIHALIGFLGEKDIGFFKQLRMDVSALYLSDPAVWQRIGFPGPSIASGGYPDFDQPQKQKITQLKETPR